MSPSLITTDETMLDVQMPENVDVTLECEATGNPKPNITWMRADRLNINVVPPGTSMLYREIISHPFVCLIVRV